MKAWAELTPEQQKRAINGLTTELLRDIVEGGIHFNDAANRDNFQATIDAAMEMANANHTPWFAHEYVMDATFTDDDGKVKSVRETIENMAKISAEDSLYAEPGENIITHGVLS